MNLRSSKLYRASLSLPLAASLFVAGETRAAAPVVEMSNTVEQLCPALKKANSSNPRLLTAAEKDVLSRCAEVKLGPGQSFEQLSQAQLNTLNNMTSEESSVMGTSTVELSGAQSAAIIGRLSVVRNTSTGGVAFSPVPTGESQDTPASAFSRPVVVQDSPTGFTEYNVVDQINGYQLDVSNINQYGRWGAFLTGGFGTGDKDATSREPGFDFDSWSLVGGIDYRFSDNFILGGALSYAVTDSSVDNNGGNVDLDGFGVSVYGTYYLDKFYVDFLAGLATKEFDMGRNVQYAVPANTGGTTVVSQAFGADTDATDVNLSIGGGYDMNYGGISVTPFGQLAYIHSDIDGYTERLRNTNTNPGFGLALEVEDQEVESFTSSLGVQVARAFNTQSGVITPYLRGEWMHEFENNSRNIVATFATVRNEFDAQNNIIIPTDDPDRNYFNLSAGVSGVFPGGYQCFLDYTTILGYDDLTVHRLVAGLRFEF